MPWMNARSSALVARFGRRLDIHRPELPCCLKSQYGGITRFGAAEKVASSPVVRSAFGICFPAYFRRAGLYSKVSIWLTPPSMKRKMQLFALLGWCGGFGAMGDTGPPVEAFASVARRSARASPPRPRYELNRRSRRVINVL